MQSYLSLFSTILILLSAGELVARTNLSIISPTTDFTTNNQTVEIRGSVVESSVGGEVIVSTNTPGGSPNLAQLTHSIYGAVVDLGSAQELKGMLIRHVVDRGFPRGPRLANLAFSRRLEPISPQGSPSTFHRV